LDDLFGILGEFNLISYLFGGHSWVIHVIFIVVMGYKSYGLFYNKKTS